jgi:methylenetetrahydrofolate reductase (NADPH)
MPADEAVAADTDKLTAFMRGWSLEAAHPTAAEIDGLRKIAPAGTHVYVPAVPHQPAIRIVEAAAQLRAAGFEPVPHVAARNYADAAELENILRRACAAGVRRALIVAGDRDQPAGPFADARSVFESNLLQRHGIAHIGISGYPDGHPRISADTLDRALTAKLAAAERAGLRVTIVTQFCFEPERIIAWLRRLRGLGIGLPVKIGVAGPSSVATLLRYASRCGVRASARALVRHAKSMRGLIGRSAPDDLLSALAEAHAREPRGEVTPHLFSFGGVVATARYASEAVAGKLD